MKAPNSLRDSARVVGWGLAVWAAVQFAAALFARSAMAATGIEAAIVEWGTGRMGVAWSDPDAAPLTGKPIARRIAVGAAWGAGVSAAAIAAALAARTASLSRGPVSFDALGIGLIVTVLAATRDELVLRGLTLRATRDHLPAWGGWLACGLVAAAARLGSDAQVPLAALAEGLRGVALAVLWTRGRGAWMAWGANVGWTWTEECVARGGLLDVRFASEAMADVPTLAILALAATFAAMKSTRSGAREDREGASP